MSSFPVAWIFVQKWRFISSELFTQIFKLKSTNLRVRSVVRIGSNCWRAKRKIRGKFCQPPTTTKRGPNKQFEAEKGQNKNSPRCGQQLTPGGSHTTHRRRCHGNEWSSVRQKIPSSTLNDFNGNFIKVNRYNGGTDPREKVRLRRVEPLHQIGSRWLSAILAATPNKIIGEIFFLKKCTQLT